MIVYTNKSQSFHPISNPIIFKPLNTASDLYKISSAYRTSQRNLQNLIDPVGGDILTRVAIPRSGSFLNTSGLARYKSRTRRATGKPGGGG